MKSADPKPTQPPPTPLDRNERTGNFPIVAIGASAGGLETFERFFLNVPAHANMAFVVIQHLDPTHSSILSSLMRSFSKLPVLEVTDEMVVRPGHVYVIPPGRGMTLRGDALRLHQSSPDQGSRTAIDSFFQSLADVLGENAICVVLSGTGSDGTAGAQAVKDAGGLVIVQDPATAKYSGMPQSAIDIDLADYILAPEEMPVQIMAYAESAFLPGRDEVIRRLPESSKQISDILAEVLNYTGHDFSLYKPSTIKRRIEHRMAISRIEDASAYLEHLREDPEEIDALFRGMLIGVTSFFRDPETWTRLEETVIPQLLEGRDPDESIRVWVPGASTGEEAYSIAILLAEAMEARDVSYEVEIFAADIDDRALERARVGVYSADDVTNLSPERLSRFFIRQGDSYVVREALRKMVYCVHQNALKDPPFSRLDLISCRNFLIYLNVELQKKLISLFHYVLKPDGALFLGASESLGEQSPLFDAVDREARIFTRADVEPRIELALDLMAPIPTVDSDTMILTLDDTAEILEEESDPLILPEDATPEQEIAALREELNLTRERLQATIEELRITNEELQSTNEELLTHETELEAQNDELRRTQEELELSCDAFSDLYDFAPVGYMTLNSEGVVEQANLTLGAMLGVSRHNLVNQKLVDYVAVGGEEAFNHFLTDLRATGGRQSYVVRMTYMDGGGEFYGQLESIAAHDTAANETHYRIAVIDVTARVEAEQALQEAHDELEGRVKTRTAELVEANESLQQEIAERERIEAALRESEGRFRTMADSAPVMIWMADETAAGTFFNETWLTFTGRSAEQEQGDGWLENIHAQDREAVARQYLDAFEARESFRADYRMYRHDGAACWVLNVGVPRFTEDGTFAGYIGSVMDITERRETEQRLEQTLARTQDLYRTSRQISSLDTPISVLETLLTNRHLADASRATVIIFDEPPTDGPPTYSEPVAVWQRGQTHSNQTKAQVSFDKHELLKLCQRDGPLVIVDSQDDPRVDSASRKSFEAVGTRSMVIYPLVASDVWYGVVAFHWAEPHQIADDEARHILGLVDQAAAAIYSFRLLADEARARQAAERANEVKIKFLAMISHELRTPLTSIQGYADTLLADDVDWDVDTQRTFIEIINDESDNLRELIEQLLDLSRLEAGMLTIHREPHPLGKVLADARSHLSVRAEEHELIYEVEDDLPFVDIDPQRIQQVILNLVHNSAKYAPPGTAIRVAAQQQGDVVRVDVDDEGPGIPPEERDVVFEAFRQAAGEVDAAQGGAGLGLAICRGIVNTHGGKIWISDEVEDGLRVSFTLPVASPEEPAA